MSRALLSLLFAFCILAQGHGQVPEEEVPCEDADTCETLEEAKKEAYALIATQLKNHMDKLNGIRQKADTVKEEITKDQMNVIDEMAADETKRIGNLTGKAFEKALKQGKDIVVFECILECELSVKKTFPEHEYKLKEILLRLQKQATDTIDGTLKKVNAIEKELKDCRSNFVKKIQSSITKMGVNWNRDQALKSFNSIMTNSEKLPGEFSGVLEKYDKEAREVFTQCKKTFAQLTEQAQMCMEGCFQ